jgi:hypothetical protein
MARNSVKTCLVAEFLHNPGGRSRYELISKSSQRLVPVPDLVPCTSRVGELNIAKFQWGAAPPNLNCTTPALSLFPDSDVSVSIKCNRCPPNVHFDGGASGSRLNQVLVQPTIIIVRFTGSGTEFCSPKVQQSRQQVPTIPQLHIGDAIS